MNTLPANRLAPLDGIRAYAIVLVFSVHFFGLTGVTVFGPEFANTPWHAINGFSESAIFIAFHSHYGVDVFFILSGYLIANVLQRGNVSTSQFLSFSQTMSSKCATSRCKLSAIT